MLFADRLIGWGEKFGYYPADHAYKYDKPVMGIDFQ
jgi:hypothetical protein